MFLPLNPTAYPVISPSVSADPAINPSSKGFSPTSGDAAMHSARMLGTGTTIEAAPIKCNNHIPPYPTLSVEKESVHHMIPTAAMKKASIPATVSSSIF